MGESMWRRPVTELSSYPTELDAHVTLTDQRRVRIRALHSREVVSQCSWRRVDRCR